MFWNILLSVELFIAIILMIIAIVMQNWLIAISTSALCIAIVYAITIPRKKRK